MVYRSVAERMYTIHTACYKPIRLTTDNGKWLFFELARWWRKRNLFRDFERGICGREYSGTQKEDCRGEWMKSHRRARKYMGKGSNREGHWVRCVEEQAPSLNPSSLCTSLLFSSSHCLLFPRFQVDVLSFSFAYWTHGPARMHACAHDRGTRTHVRTHPGLRYAYTYMSPSLRRSCIVRDTMSQCDFNYTPVKIPINVNAATCKRNPGVSNHCLA